MHFSIGPRNEKEAVSDQVSIVYIYIFAMLYGVYNQEGGDQCPEQEEEEI